MKRTALSPGSASDLADELVALATAALRCHPELSVDTPQAQALLRDRAVGELEKASEVRVLADGTRAAIVLYRAADRFLGDAQRCRVELALGDDEARQWVAQQLGELVRCFDVSCELHLDVGHRALLPSLEAIGLKPRMTWLHGDPRVALRHLRAGPMRRSALGHELRIEPLRHERHVSPVVALLRDSFGRESETGYLSPRVAVTEAVQARLDSLTRDRLRAALGARTTLVVLRGDEPVGYGAYHPRDDRVLGRHGGLAIGFAPEIRGRGVGKLVYERLLEAMVAARIPLMRGRTANPAVLHLARRMRRPVRGWQLELRGTE